MGATAFVASFLTVLSAESHLTDPVINDPRTLREVEDAFAGYNRALNENDIEALNTYFYESPLTVRYGNAENLYGHAEIARYRSSVRHASMHVQRERTVILTFGDRFATVSTLSRRRDSETVGRTTQTWVKFPEGWKIVAAHVSSIVDR